jgi:3-phosphoshikimate 1-carboxyvinyltransferase
MAPLTFRVPGSKSQTQRALLLAALARGESRLVSPLDCDDSRHLRRALGALGVEVVELSPACPPAEVRERATRSAGEEWKVRGGYLRTPMAPLWCGEGGTTLRFLAPLSLIVDGQLSLDGSARLRERPLVDLVRSLERLGVRAEGQGAQATLPLSLCRERAPGDRAEVDVSKSSQFASGLLMVGPLLPEGLHLELTGAPVSRPYLEMTRTMMDAFGARTREEGRALRALPGYYSPCTFVVEGDWSSAAFLLAAGWIRGVAVELENCSDDSTQGDRVIGAFLEELSRPGPHRFDLGDCPDLVAPLAAAAAFCDHRVELVNVSHARLKESDRLATLAEGLRRAGVRVEERPDALVLIPGGRLVPARLDPRGDHRMAMALALLSLREPGIVVETPGCVTKSYPSFWDDLERFR